jgi:molybdopterin biosynthesis enzyme MoaB
MSKNPKKREFVALNIAVLTVSDSRTEETDKSGKLRQAHRRRSPARRKDDRA